MLNVMLDKEIERPILRPITPHPRPAFEVFRMSSSHRFEFSSTLMGDDEFVRLHDQSIQYQESNFQLSP
jgi:hypothetical protein